MICDKISKENSFCRAVSKHRFKILTIFIVLLIGGIILQMKHMPSHLHRNNGTSENEIVSGSLNQQLQSSTENANDQAYQANKTKCDEPVSKFDKDSSPIFLVQLVVKKSDLINANFICFIQNSNLSCPSYMEIYTEWAKTESQYDFFNDNNGPIISVFGVTQISFQNTSLVYKIRQKFRMKGVGYIFEQDSPESVFSSPDFNWENKIYLSSRISTIIGVDTDPQFKDIEHKCIHGDNFNFDFCKSIEGKRKFQEFTNGMRALFGLKSFNVTFQIGFTSDWPLVTVEISGVGIIHDGWTHDDVFLNTIKLDRQRQDWCLCMDALKDKLVNTEDAKKMCFRIHKIRMEFEKQFEDKKCHLEDRIRTASIG